MPSPSSVETSSAAPSSRFEDAAPFADASEQNGARTARAVAIYALSFAAVTALPIWRSADFMQSADLGVVAAVVFAGVAWHLWRHVPPSRCSLATVALAWSGLAFAAWQLAWIQVQDFWFLRLATVACGIGVVALWGGGWRGWRVVAALAVWSCWLGGSNGRLDAWVGGSFARHTAAIAGWLLWQGGQNLSVRGAVVETPHGIIEVGSPCTGLPLASLLLMLLLVATLLLRLSRGALLRIAVWVVAGAFALGVARVALLILLVGRKEAFDYWHGPEGGAWISALGIVGLAWLVHRHLRSRPGEARTGARPRGAPSAFVHACWPIAAAAISALLLGSTAAIQPAASEDAPPAWPGATVVHNRLLPLDSNIESPIDRFASERQVTYELGPDAHVEVWFAPVPLLFTGDPRAIPATWRDASAIDRWTVSAAPGGGELWIGVGRDRTLWLATLTLDGRSIARHQDWVTHYRGAFRRPARWIDWIAHRRPLADKQAAWIRLSCATSDAAQADANLGPAFAAWRTQAAELDYRSRVRAR